MNMTQLKYFIAVCDEGSISKASQELYISKQGLSRSLQSLEKELRHPLLIRTLNGIQPTGTGTTAYQYAKKILENYDDLMRAVGNETERPVRQLRIAFSHGFFACISTDLLFSFLAGNPQIHCEQFGFSDMELRKKFRERQIDLALGSGSREDLSFEYTVLFRNRRCLYVNAEHPFARRGIISVAELKGELIGVPGEGYFDRPFILEQCRKFGFEPRLFLCEGLDVMTQFAQSGRGVSLLVDNLSGENPPPNVRIVHFDDEEAFSYDVFIMTEQGNRNPDTRKFIQHAKTYCQHLKTTHG